MTDYTELIDRMQRTLARQEEDLLRPSVSGLFKLDPEYCLVLMPAFVEHLARVSAAFPSRVEQALVRTGNIITRPSDRAHTMALRLVRGDAGGRVYRVRAAFLLTEFVERALRLYSDRGGRLPLADVSISPLDRERVERFFGQKTPPASMAYALGPEADPVARALGLTAAPREPASVSRSASARATETGREPSGTAASSPKRVASPPLRKSAPAPARPRPDAPSEEDAAGQDAGRDTEGTQSSRARKQPGGRTNTTGTNPGPHPEQQRAGTDAAKGTKIRRKAAPRNASRGSRTFRVV